MPFSVGIVGMHENLSAMQALRDRLDPRVYLWVNAYQREPDYYTREELTLIRAVDPLFDLNNQHYPSRGQSVYGGAAGVSISTTRAICADASSWAT